MIFLDQVDPVQPHKDVTIVFDDRATPSAAQIIRAKCDRDEMVVSTEYDQHGNVTNISIRVGKFELLDASKSAIIDKLKTLPVVGVRVNDCFIQGAPLSVSIDFFTYEVGQYSRVPIWLLQKNGALTAQFIQPITDIRADDWPRAPSPSRLDRQPRRKP